jgi:hypothetical protein
VGRIAPHGAVCRRVTCRLRSSRLISHSMKFQLTHFRPRGTHLNGADQSVSRADFSGDTFCYNSIPQHAETQLTLRKVERCQRE